jgi:hypothetical protein
MGAIVLASVAVAGFAAVAIAYMLGWVGARGSLPTSPASIATPGQQVAGTAPDMGLLPGESLVTMPEPPKSAIAPPAPAQLPDASRPVPPPPKAKAQPRSETTHARIAPPPADLAEVCVNCGLVYSIEAQGDFWDVVVHYGDGSSQTLRYPERPRLRAGQRVYLEDGRLVPERGQ